MEGIVNLVMRELRDYRHGPMRDRDLALHLLAIPEIADALRAALAKLEQQEDV